MKRDCIFNEDKCCNCRICNHELIENGKDEIGELRRQYNG